MPYIKSELRKKFEIILFYFKVRKELQNMTAGEINYLLTIILDRQLGPSITYARANELIGVLECVKLEIYRQVISKYEDLKERENGTVYEKRN